MIESICSQSLRKENVEPEIIKQKDPDWNSLMTGKKKAVPCTNI